MTEASARKERREQRQRALGVDCVDRLTWKEWEPGREYTRKILVKNVDRVSQTIQLSLPTHRKTFITPFPEPVTLSSGVSHEIAISFRPAELVELHDAVTITVNGRGSFQVRLDCLTPYAKLALPSSHDFGYCAVGTTAHAQVQLRNSGTAAVEFSWEVSAPFCVLPSHAMLDEGEVMHMTLLFTPTEACAMVAQAVCRLTGMDDVIASLRISGIGKHPYICFQEPSAEEGTLVVQMEAQLNSGSNSCSKLIHLCNPSPVPVSVHIRRVDESLLCAFRITAEGDVKLDRDDPNEDGAFLVPRGAVQPLRLHYTPGSPGVIDFNTFQVECAHGNLLQIELSGTTVGPRVSVSASSLNYEAVNMECMPTAKQLTRHITLQNTSASDAPFTWVSTSPGAAFVVAPHSGVIAAQSSVQVAVTFQPTHPILYYRRLHLLVEGAKDVIGVDLLGGGYTSAQRPPTLTLADVEAARLRAERGLGLLTPEELADVAAAALAVSDAPGNWHDPRQIDGQRRSGSVITAAAVDAWRRVEEDVRSTGVVMRGVKRKVRAPLSSLETPNGTVAIDTPFGVDAKPLYTFGGVGGGGGSSSSSGGGGGGSDGRGQLVTVMNTSNVAAVATWSVPAPQLCPYAVVPTQQLVPPHGSAVFQVQCSSAATDELPAACSLECYVNFESMSTFYLAPDGCVMPPQCFTVMCTHTSASAAVSTSARQKAHQQQPQQQQQQQGVSAQIRCARQVCLPACRLGTASYQVIALQNTTAAPVRFEVTAVTLKQVSAVVAPPNSVPVAPERAATAAERAAPPDAGDVSEAVFAVFPTAGVIPPVGRQLLVVKFCPRETAQYAATATLVWNATVSHASSPPATAQPSSAAADTTHLSLLGEVCLPQLQWRQPGEDAAVPLSMITFPPGCVSGEAQQRAWVRNPTALPVEFRSDTSEGLLGVLRMEPEWGIVPGGARLPVTIFFSPQQHRVFDGLLQLYVQDGATETAGPNATQLCYRQQLRVRGEGVHADVEVEPRIIDAGEAADTREQQAALTLYNSGYCDVQYDVRAMLVHAGKIGAGAAVVPRLHNSRGVLPARTHTSLLMAAQPAPGLTEFVVYAVVSGLGTCVADVPDASTPEEAERHPHCRWRLRAAHPAVQVVDVDFPGVARPLAWQQLSLNAINAQLAAAAAESEDCGSGADSFSFQHYVSGLDPISMDLGVAHEGDAVVSLTISLKNTGDCPAPFDVMLPTQHEANIEHWCLENAELADLHYIIERGLVTVSPQQGSIDVGQTVQLEVRYVHDEVGVHRLPMLLRVGRGGRRVAVVLEGRTLPAEVRALNFHHEKVYELMPVALGDMEPPLQFITVTNPLHEPVEYAVDLVSLQEHAREHHGFPVFQCADPQGTVPPHGIAHIGFYFRPLEAREYRVTVLVQAAHGEGYYVDLVGRGYHPRKVTTAAVAQWIEAALRLVPAAPPALVARTRTGFLCDDVCTLGAVPYFALCRRTCTLHIAADCAMAMRYTWHADRPQRGDAQAVVLPAEGVVQPGGTQTFKVLFYAGSTSQVLDRLLMCTVAPCTAVRSEDETQRVGSAARPGRRTTATPHLSASASRLGGSGAVSLSLLLQARIMPRDDFEALYGEEKLCSVYTPALYNSHVDPTASSTAPVPAAASPATGPEVRFVKGVMDELIRSVVAAPAVQSSFTALCAPRPVTYANMRVLHAAKTCAVAPPPPPSGAVGTSSAVAVEEVLEDLLRGALAEAVTTM
ncbi:MSP (Major sperm protein) domain containing protein [Novymonas esmeraldas]|uniref:MSP (Major sperm protein) domain containing protein n=1 Tax=Novymonas esmeraldas TaxID=1808958 RepID=A0AAW0EQ16_9TRYP